jgi:putative copper export protein
MVAMIAMVGRVRRVRSVRGLALAAALAFATVVPQGAARAQSSEERFQDLFITAGYCTAFGAALGTAFLAWTENPAENLRYVAVGASLGFIGGSLLGTYVIFSPMVADGQEPVEGSLLTAAPMPTDTVVIRPTWDREGQRLAAVEGGMTLFKF